MDEQISIFEGYKPKPVIKKKNVKSAKQLQQITTLDLCRECFFYEKKYFISGGYHKCSVSNDPRVKAVTYVKAKNIACEKFTKR